MNSYPLAQWQWVSKLAAKFLPDDKDMQHWGLCNHAKCPWCLCTMEDKDHIFKCLVESTMKQWEKALEELDQWLEGAKTHPQLRKDIIGGLQQWHDQTWGCRPISYSGINGRTSPRWHWVGICTGRGHSKTVERTVRAAPLESLQIQEVWPTMDNSPFDPTNDDPMGHVEPPK